MTQYNTPQDVLTELRNFSHRDSRHALGLIDQALGQWPKNLLLRSARIQYLTKSGYAQEAAAAADQLDRTIEINSPSILHNIAMAYAANHRNTDAVNTARRALALPSNKRPTVYIEMGDVLMKNGLNEEALSAVQEGLTQYPAQLLLRNMTLQLQGELGHKDQALALIDDSLKNAPYNPQLRNAITLTFNGLGMRQDAMESARQAVYEYPYDDNAQGNLVKLLIATGDFEQAEQAADASVQNTPHNDHRRAMLAMAALTNGNMNKAAIQIDNLREYSRLHTLHEAVEGEFQFRSGAHTRAEPLLARSQHYGIRMFECILWQACNTQSGQDSNAMQQRIPAPALPLIQQEAATLNQAGNRQQAATALRQRLFRQSLHMSRIPSQLPTL